ncbi:4-phosphoerythronate dehydrogenase [Aliikangiella coralliicola]|uniref:4-phosphoerythronate dehydrogenase n=1 Tax=Aliikangiella coralliicola TaxID=2592383 RepID=UPI00143DBEE8|nr:4-phosphoerythronate dehydrogenase [Aliikangiella coralliicola]
MSKPFKIVADENMPHIEKLFGSVADITYRAGREITAQDVRHADALLCRSITSVDQSLLANSNVQFVGTATIGIDHLDIPWLESKGIAWANAAGCNAAAVAQYVISAIAFWLKRNDKQFDEIKVGIVGAGNVGSELARCLEILGVDYLLCDPPLQKKMQSQTQKSQVQIESAHKLKSFDEILRCDVVTLHVPITKVGEDKTLHLVDGEVLNRLKKDQLLINSARGEVINNVDLLTYLRAQNAASVILDVFECEPDIDHELANLCLLATPHIAGHTLEGKLRGSYMVYRAFCRQFNLPVEVDEADLYPEKNLFEICSESPQENLLQFYDIERDSKRLLSVDAPYLAAHFDEMRKDYVTRCVDKPRRDYSGWQGKSELSPVNADSEAIYQLMDLT